MAVARGAVLPSRITISTRTIRDPMVAKAFDDLTKAVNDELEQRVTPNVPFVPLLVSPSGYIFSITVDDNGNLGTTLIRKPT